MSLWERLEKLGEGSYGFVSLGRPLEGHSLYPSVQVMAVKSAEYNDSSTLIHERDLLSSFKDCPHIIRYLGYDFTMEGNQSFTNIFLEYASGGTLQDQIQSKATKHRGLSDDEARKYTLSILKGLDYVHHKGYVHCDIKPENILIVDEKAKIGDFGLAIDQPLNLPGMTLGTPHYMAPETIDKGEYDFPTDIWALGCSLFEMITGVPQWKCNNRKESLLKLIKRSKMSKDTFDFWKMCTIKDPKQRWNANMLLQHPFIIGGSHDPPPVQNNA